MAANEMISGERIELGRWIYSAWKHLRQFPLETSAPFEATVIAGKSCDLLGRMRQLAPYTPTSLLPLAADSIIPRIELEHTIVPILRAVGVFQVTESQAGIESIEALVISQDDVMDQTARIWEHLRPAAAERGAIEILRCTATLPMTRDEVTEHCVALGYTEEETRHALELAEAPDLVKSIHVGDFNADFFYNDFLWGENIAQTTAALAALSADVRDSLRSLLDELHEHEGRPLAEVESASPDLVKLASAQGLIDATEIRTAEGKHATFHFTPRFRGFGISQEDTPDALDQVKLVIASFAFSTRFARYRLKDPERFLDSLIGRGYAGNATPIGTDYGAMERQKIVDVEPVDPGGERYRFRALKHDTLVEARDTMKAGALLVPNPRGSSGESFLRDPQRFSDPVATRTRLAREPGRRPLYDAALLAAIRDAAHQDRFR